MAIFCLRRDLLTSYHEIYMRIIMTEKKKNVGNGIGIGAALGVSFGVIYGNKSGNLSQSIALGIAIGVAIGAIFDFVMNRRNQLH